MQDSRLYGVELDSITGRIAQKLYPEASIKVAGFETTDRRDFYDLAVGNVPFGQYRANDKAYNKLGFSIHNYFFAKAIDQVRPGGIVAFVTSRYTLDSKDSSARKHIAERANLLGAIRLPNSAFKANAGTEVVSDIIFLQKRDRPIDHEPDWVQLGKTEDGFAINQYFVDHPEMVLGELTSESTQYGREECTVHPIEGAVLADQLAEAVQHIEGQYTEVEVEIPDIADMRFVFKMIVFPFWLITAFLALMLKWTLNLSAFVLALPMLYIFGCGLYTLYCREWMQFLILMVAELGCFLLLTAGTVIVEAVEWFSGWIAEL